MQNNTSTLNILVSLEAKVIQQLLDEKLPDPLIEDLSPPGAKGIVINARKKGKIKIKATGNTFHYQIPLQIHTYKSMMLGDIDVTFEILLSMKTQYIVRDDWQLVTRTELVETKWITKPKLNLGFINLPIESILNEAIENNQAVICKRIDKEVMTQLDVRSPLNNLLAQLPNPVVIMDTEKIWWQCDTIDTSIAPFTTAEDWIYVTVGAKAPFYFSYGKELEIVNPELRAPDITLDLEKESTVRTSCYLDFATLEKTATKFLQKKEFEIKGQKIKINKVQINGLDEKLSIKVNVEGSYDGTVTIAAQPFFDQERQEIQLKNPELNLTGDNLRSKMISLVAEKAIEAKMSEFLNFPIQTGIDLLNEKIASTQVPPNLMVNAKLNTVDIPLFNIEKTGLSLGIVAECEVVLTSAVLV